MTDPSGVSASTHWREVYAVKKSDETSWHQAVPQPSLDWIVAARPDRAAAIIDVGAGTSSLVDHLLLAGYRDLAALDVSDAALIETRSRLGAAADHLQWIVSDVTEFHPTRQYDLWHDRAVLHFLTHSADRERYVDVLRSAVSAGGHVLLATFAIGGPTRCSGLEVVQYDAASLADLLGPEFERVREAEVEHLTPSGAPQRFTFALFQRTAGTS